MKDNSRVKVCEKSRRIGLSWADAAIAALDAAAGSSDTFYLGYNREMSEQYVEDVGFWAKSYQLAANPAEVLQDEDEDILVYRVRFASGRKVVALSSRPSNLRAKKGKVVIDEAAFHQDFDELLKAAMAILAWGGQVRIISTHDGVDNPFNRVCQEIRDGTLNYSLHRYPLDDAIADGLYKRICLVNHWQWSPQGEIAWRNQLWEDYGVGASEELGCTPLDVRGGGKIFQRNYFRIIPQAPVLPHTVRFWDMAATSKDVKNDAFYTAGVKAGRLGDDIFVLDARADQIGPAEGDDWIVQTAIEDGKYCDVRWELEGGSAGLKVAESLKRRLKGYNAEGIKPLGDKVSRALPVASDGKRGNLYLVKGDWNEQFVDALYKFDGTPKPLVNDLTDALSGVWSCLQRPGDSLFEAYKRERGIR